MKADVAPWLGLAHVRDSKGEAGPVASLTPTAWTEFVGFAAQHTTYQPMGDLLVLFDAHAHLLLCSGRRAAVRRVVGPAVVVMACRAVEETLSRHAHRTGSRPERDDDGGGDDGPAQWLGSALAPTVGARLLTVAGGVLVECAVTGRPVERVIAE